MSSVSPLRVAVLGAGERGSMFGRLLAELPHMALVVAVAEPRDDYRARFVATHGLSEKQAFRSWADFVAKPPACDAVIVATMDREHVGPAVACLDKGMHMLLEKPMAVTLEDCRTIEAAQRRSGACVAVCHSLRYNKGFDLLRSMVNAGRAGEIVSVDQIEPVKHWHQAHSFVRGNWGNEARSTFMLLAKSCHDLDYIAHLIGRPCLRVASFGALNYFNRSHAPAGAPPRCTDGCPVESVCAYSAIKQYVNAEHLDWWPAGVVSTVHTKEAHLEAIRTGPYGRCVYQCDNDAVDHQVVAFEFAGNVTATFTMTAFSSIPGRQLRVHGTEGELLFDEKKIVIHNFGTGNTETIELGPETGSHGGGDARAVRAWLDAILARDSGRILTSAQESLRTHMIVFAAERARREKRLVEIAEM